MTRECRTFGFNFNLTFIERVAAGFHNVSQLTKYDLQTPYLNMKNIQAIILLLFSRLRKSKRCTYIQDKLGVL
jgi:hypothetical protein